MRRALGKGLSQLIAEQYEGAPTEAPIGSIRANPRQPRTHFDGSALGELAASIAQFGILQPLVVRPVGDSKYELVAGERRLRAAKLAGLKAVPIVIRTAGTEASLELALIENIQREDINPLECARAYRTLIDEFGLTQEAVADKVGKSRAGVANVVRLLRLPKRIQEGLEQGLISEAHARTLLSFESPAHQLAVYDQILERGLSVHEVEKAAKARSKKKRAKADRPSHEDPNWSALEEALSTHFGSPTRLLQAEAGGKLQVEFYSDDDLERILSVIGITL